MRILYAANRRNNVHWQLNRFITATNNKHNIRIAAYKGKNYEYYIDWILDALCDIFTGVPCFGSTAMEIYREQIKRFSPDLIISDCEIITSTIANDLKIPLWQVSPLLLWYAKTNILIYKQYPKLFSENEYTAPMTDLVKMSDRSFVYSHFGDVGLALKSNIGWVRPYHTVGQISSLFEHNMVAVSTGFNKHIIDRLKINSDAVLFIEAINETHSIKIKSLINDQEYASNVRNAKMLVMPANMDLLADAFYNNKFVWMLPDFTQQEVMANIMLSEYLSLGKTIYDISNDKIDIMPNVVSAEYDNSINHLDKELDQL